MEDADDDDDCVGCLLCGWWGRDAARPPASPEDQPLLRLRWREQPAQAASRVVTPPRASSSSAVGRGATLALGGMQYRVDSVFGQGAHCIVWRCVPSRKWPSALRARTRSARYHITLP